MMLLDIICSIFYLKKKIFHLKNWAKRKWKSAKYFMKLFMKERIEIHTSVLEESMRLEEVQYS